MVPFWSNNPVTLWRRRIEEAGTRDAQKLEATSVLPELEALDVLLVERTGALEHLFAMAYDARNGGPPSTPGVFEIGNEIRRSHWMSAGALCSLVLDVVPAFFLAQGWLDLPEMWAGTIGVVIAAALSFTCKGAVAKFIGEAKAARRRLNVVAAGSFIASLLLSVILLSTRAPSKAMANYMATYGGVLMALLSVSLALLAGSLFAAANEYGYSRQYARDHQGLRENRGRIAGLKNWIANL